MKFFPIFTVAAAVSCGAAHAADSFTCENVVGVLPVNSSAANTVVAVPWLAAGVGDSSIAVSNVVKTANLTVGDLLYWYDAANKNYQAWILASGSPAAYWAPVDKVTENGIETAQAPDTLALSRGCALILHRQNPSAGVFYLSGQVASAGASAPSSTMVASSSESPADVYTLVAPPSTAATSLNSLTWNASCANGDKIYLAAGAGLTYKNGQWGTETYNSSSRTWEFSTAGATVPAGQGFWYVRSAANAGSSLTVTWN